MSEDDLVRFRGRLVNRKEARALRGVPPPIRIQQIVQLFEKCEYLTVKQIMMKVGFKTEASARYWIRWGCKNNFLWNADEPKIRGAHYDLANKGVGLLQLLKEGDEEVSENKSTKLLWKFEPQTTLFKPKVPKEVQKSFRIPDQIALTLLDRGKIPLTDLKQSVKGYKFGFEKYFPLIQKSGFVELSVASGQSELYELTQSGKTWAKATAMAHEMATRCVNCRGTILPYEPGYQEVDSLCEHCVNLSFTQS